MIRSLTPNRLRNKFRRFGAALALALLLLTPAMSLTANAYSPLGDACHGKGNKSAVCKDSRKQSGADSKNPLVSMLGKIIQIIILVAGVAAVILIIVSGFKFMGASDPQAAASARGTLLNAVIGVIVVSLAYFIVGFVTGNI